MIQLHRVLWSGSRDPSIIHSRFLRFTSTTQPTVRSQNIRRKLSRRVLMIKVSNCLGMAKYWKDKELFKPFSLLQLDNAYINVFERLCQQLRGQMTVCSVSSTVPYDWKSLVNTQPKVTSKIHVSKYFKACL